MLSLSIRREVTRYGKGHLMQIDKIIRQYDTTRPRTRGIILPDYFVNLH